MYRIYCFSLLIILANVKAQENLTYQKPSDEILNLVDVKLPPRVFMDESKKYMVCIYRDAYKTIKELSEPEMRLAGLRINPKTNIGSAAFFAPLIFIDPLSFFPPWTNI